MKYRTIPFARPRGNYRRTVSPIIPGGGLMNGIEPALTRAARVFGPLGPRSGMGRFSAEFPNSAYLGAMPTSPAIRIPPASTPGDAPSSGKVVAGIPVPPIPAANKTTVVMRSDDSKAPGFPGFYQWLSDWNPALFDRAIAATPPHLVSATKVLRTGGATISGLRGLYAGSFANRAGLGDTTAYSSYTTDGSSSYTPPLISTTADPGVLQTVSIASTGESTASPTPTTTGAAQLVSALVSAGQTVLTDVNQQTLFNTNLQRAAAGLPPLTGTGTAITGIASSPTTLLIIGGAALALIFLMSKSKAA